MRLYLLRHAESAPARDLGERDWPLSERGRRQAGAIVPRLASLGVVRAVTSPYPRARDTVAPFATAAGLVLEVDDRLRERSWGGGWLDDFDDHARASWHDLDHRVLDGETCSECLARFGQAIDEFAGAGRPTLVASHGTAIGIYLRAIGVDFDYEKWRAMAMPHLYALELGAASHLIDSEPLAQHL